MPVAVYLHPISLLRPPLAFGVWLPVLLPMLIPLPGSGVLLQAFPNQLHPLVVRDLADFSQHLPGQFIVLLRVVPCTSAGNTFRHLPTCHSAALHV